MSCKNAWFRRWLLDPISGRARKGSRDDQKSAIGIGLQVEGRGGIDDNHCNLREFGTTNRSDRNGTDFAANPLVLAIPPHSQGLILCYLLRQMVNQDLPRIQTTQRHFANVHLGITSHWNGYNYPRYTSRGIAWILFCAPTKLEFVQWRSLGRMTLRPNL